MDREKLKAGLAGALQKAADTAKQTAQTVAADAKQTAQNVAADAMQTAQNVAADAKQRLKKKPEPAPEGDGISAENALRVIYYLMAANGTVFHSEEEKFDAIGAEFDPDFAEKKPDIIKACQAQLEKVIDPEDYYDVLQDGVEAALSDTAKGDIMPRLLVWNLLTVAYSDECYDDIERRLVKYVVRKLDIDKTVFLEMESSMLTMRDIENELAWIKTTDRPYLTIEARVNELKKRKTVIFDSVKDLITL